MFLMRPVGGMPARLFLSGCFLLALASLVLCAGRANWHNTSAAAARPVAADPLLAPEARSRVLAKYSDVPIAFERNDGQTDPQVKFLARAHGYTIFLTPSEALVSLSASSAVEPHTHALQRRAQSAQPVRSMVRMQLVGANPRPQITGEDKLPGISNYFLGNNPKNWRTAIPQYSRVSYHDVYPGVDLAFHGAHKQLEFDLLVNPGVSPQNIALKFSGAAQLRTDDSGGLVLSAPAGDLHLHKPVAYQENNGVRQPVDAQFVIKGDNVAFALGAYDASRQLVIDPTVSYATYLGGTGDDEATAVAVDNNGNAYITGETAGAGFPSNVGPAFAGPPHDAFVTKLDPTKSGAASRVYSTFIGGTNDDSGNAIAVDASGNAYVAGGTLSTDLPSTMGVVQTTSNGAEEAFIAKLGPTGTITYLTYLGGASADFAQAIAVDSGGNAYVAGETQSPGFPTKNSFQASIGGASDAFVSVLNSTATALTYSTFLGGLGADTATAIAIDSSGKIYVTGNTNSSPFPTTPGVFQTSAPGGGDAFVAKLDPAKAGSSSLVYSTYLGGSGSDSGHGIAVDSTGAAYVTGLTQSSLFPTQSPLQASLKGSQDAFVTKLNATATALLYSTYLGGGASDSALAIALDGAGNAYITGQTSSTDFPTLNPTQSTLRGGKDAFVTALNSAGSALVFSTFLGGSLDEDANSFAGIALDSANNIYVVGSTASIDFPVTTSNALLTANQGATDAFAVKITAATPPAFTLTATAPSPNPVAKGSSATSTITLNPSNGFTSAVALTCSGPAGITCTPNPASVTPASPTSTLTINVSSTASLGSPSVTHDLRPFYALLLPIPGLVLVGIGLGSARSRNRRIVSLLLGSLALAALVLQMACGSSSTPPPPPPGPRSYSVTVTGTGGGQTSSVAVSGTFQ